MYSNISSVFAPTFHPTQTPLPAEASIPQGPINDLITDISKHIFSYLEGQDFIHVFQVNKKWNVVTQDIFLQGLHRQLHQLFDQVKNFIEGQVDEKLKNSLLPEFIKYKEEVEQRNTFNTVLEYQQFFLAQKEPLIKILSHFSRESLKTAKLSLPFGFENLKKRAINTFHCDSWIAMTDTLQLTAENLETLKKTLPQRVQNQYAFSVGDRFIDITIAPKKGDCSSLHCFIRKEILEGKLLERERVFTVLSANRKKTYYLHLRPASLPTIEFEFNFALAHGGLFTSVQNLTSRVAKGFFFIPQDQA